MTFRNGHFHFFAIHKVIVLAILLALTRISSRVCGVEFDEMIRMDL